MAFSGSQLLSVDPEEIYFSEDFTSVKCWSVNYNHSSLAVPVKHEFYFLRIFIPNITQLFQQLLLPSETLFYFHHLFFSQYYLSDFHSSSLSSEHWMLTASPSSPTVQKIYYKKTPHDQVHHSDIPLSGANFCSSLLFVLTIKH